MFVQYIEQHLMPKFGTRYTLFALDLCLLQKTPPILASLRSYNIMPTLILGVCTSLIQRLDISITRPLKTCIRDLTDEAPFDCECLEAFEKWTIGDRRILTTS